MKVICANCGKPFEAKRATAKYCSAKCRVAYNRKPSINDLMQTAIDAIHDLAEYDVHSDDSYELVIALKTIERIARMQAIADAGSWWRCKECWTAVRKDLPAEGDCKCDSPKWVLQKTML